jgi:hypothetical protein
MVHLHHFSKIKSHKRSQKIVGIKVFLPKVFLFDDRRIQIRTSADGSGSRRPKNIRIHNTGKKVPMLYLEDCSTMKWRIFSDLGLPPHRANLSWRMDRVAPPVALANKNILIFYDVYILE